MLSNTENSFKATKIDILVTLPNSYDKGKELAKDFVNGKIVIVNFVRLSIAEKQRVFDYLNGVAYVINTEIKQITADTIVYLPSNFEAMKIRL